MRSPILRRLIALLGLCGASVTLPAASAQHPAIKSVVAEAAQGLQISLSTSGYKFYAAAELASAGEKTHAPWIRSRVRESFTASALLANFSATDAPFTFPDPVAAARHFKFRVFDSAGTQVWESDAGTSAPQVETTAVLPKHSRWRSVVRVPLKVDGQWLPAGRYTLEASVAGELGATVRFEVAWPPIATDTGIRGQVLQNPDIHIRLDGTAIAPAVMPWGVKAIVRIVEHRTAGDSRPPFVWTGSTDDQGYFRVSTPPGLFSVSATREGAPPVEGSNVAGLQLFPLVTVTAGRLTEQTIYLGGKITYEPLRADTGIRGSVFTDTTGAGAQTGLAGARVRVGPAPLANGGTLILLGGPFKWEGVADGDGRFELNTRPGRYRITVARPGASTAPFVLAASVDVIVENGKFSAAQLHVPGEIPPPTPNARLVASLGNVKGVPVGAGGEILRIDAQGMVPTGGWSNPQLRARPTTDPAVLEFDFVAEPPEGIATQAFEPVTASLQIPWSDAIGTLRVHSQTNSVTLYRIIFAGQRSFGP